MNNNNVTIVIDIDDTICFNKDRDYKNAIPIRKTIDAINKWHDNGATIYLYTARGMKSCNEDLDAIVKKNDKILRDWLDENGVKYDKIYYGKPLGDLYIDDKALNLSDLQEDAFSDISGQSGYKTYRIGNIVKKNMSEKSYRQLKEWYKESAGIANNPKWISNLYTTVYMEFIDGICCNKKFGREELSLAIDEILKYKQKKEDRFDIDYHISVIELNRAENDDEWNKIIDDCISRLKKIDWTGKASLSHMDFTLSNTICKDGKIYVVDTGYERGSSSYLLDFSKLRFSLNGYDENFAGGAKVDSGIKEEYENFLKQSLTQEEYDSVLALETMWWIRIYRYQKDKDKVKFWTKECIKRNGQEI